MTTWFRCRLGLSPRGEAADLKAVYDIERQWRCVVCTRAREFPWVSGAEPVSELLEDLMEAKVAGTYGIS
jgi:hypothetical protein